MYFYQMMSLSSVINFCTDQEIEKNESPSITTQMFWMSGVAIACLTLAVWQVVQRKPWTALAISVGGICIEVALNTLYRREIVIPSASPSLDSDCQTDESAFLIEEDEPLSFITKLEKCYPVKAIDPDQIKDKQAGGIMGQACGDAIGLFTEFTTRKEAQKMINSEPIDLGDDYPAGFQHGSNWRHIIRFTKNGWTDDTDQALSLLRAIYRTMTEKDRDERLTFEILFAIELLRWRRSGLRTCDPFIGRNKPRCMGLGALVSKVLRYPTFLKNPHMAANKIWAKNREAPLQNRPAANGAIMRTAPIGLIFYQSLADVVSYTIAACKVTHADPRCTASCVALTLAIALSLRGYDSDAIFEAAEEGGLAVLREELDLVAESGLLSEEESQDLDKLYEKTAEEFKAHLHGNWETLDLDEGYKVKGEINKIGYTFKCMGTAFYALNLANLYQKEGKEDIFRKIIEEIAAEGGDADTNGAAAGALLGVYLGLDGQFPNNWITNLADAPVMEQARQHIEELSMKHQQMLKEKIDVL